MILWKLFRVDSDGASSWPKGCCTSRRCCCWTSRARGSIHACGANLSDYLERLRDESGMTILLTTHLMEEADRCDRIAILDRGQLVALNTPRQLKEQIGGDVISVETGQPQPLAEQISKHFNIVARVLGGSVRIERSDGHKFITDLVEAFPGQIDAVSIHKPTLEDVFIRLTGHRFEGGEA